MNKREDKFTHTLAIICLVMCFAYFFYISIVSHKDPVLLNVVTQVMTAMVSFVTIILGYFFGASRSGQQKDDNINTLINNQDEKAKSVPKVDNAPPPPEWEQK